LKKTGEPFLHWLSIVQESGLSKHKAIIDYLKSEYDFSYGYANIVSTKARGANVASMSGIVLADQRYKGKENLLPICQN
jgi:hypothetical protein